MNEQPTGTVEVNPALFAEETRSTPMPHDDDRLSSACDLKTFPATAERRRAIDLGLAARKASLADGEAAARAELVAADGGEAGLRALAPVWAWSERRVALLEGQLSSVMKVPGATVSPKRAKLSFWGKLVFLAGDTAVIGVPQWRQGTETWMALLTGLSTALAMVAIGSMVGKTRTEFDQRESRGDAPAGASTDVTDLYRAVPSNVGRGLVSLRADMFWLYVGLIAAAIACVAVTLYGVAIGEPSGVALFAGMLAALTCPGSAALEAYGTNAAADRKQELIRLLNAGIAGLRDLATEAKSTVGHRAAVASRRYEATQRAEAVGITSAVIADRSPDNPRIFDYAEQNPSISEALLDAAVTVPECTVPAPSPTERPIWDRRPIDEDANESGQGMQYSLFPLDELRRGVA